MFTGSAVPISTDVLSSIVQRGKHTGAASGLGVIKYVVAVCGANHKLLASDGAGGLPTVCRTPESMKLKCFEQRLYQERLAMLAWHHAQDGRARFSSSQR